MFWILVGLSAIAGILLLLASRAIESVLRERFVGLKCLLIETENKNSRPNGKWKRMSMRTGLAKDEKETIPSQITTT